MKITKQDNTSKTIQPRNGAPPPHVSSSNFLNISVSIESPQHHTTADNDNNPPKKIKNTTRKAKPMMIEGKQRQIKSLD